MSERSFPQNAWYAAAWDHEVKRGFLTRTICDRPVVLFRTSSGKVVALEDACWHRLVPLSIGYLDGDNVVCGYHGLIFEPGGRCVHMPSQETINPSACVRSYPVVERHRFIWIWTGNPAFADPDKIPDMHWNDDPAWTGDGSMIELKANYRLAVDNLMDLTHETFVHAGSIGNLAVADAPFSVSHSDYAVTVTRWMLDIDPPGFWAAQLGKPGKVDRWQIIHFEAPNTITIDVGVAPSGSGAPQGDRSAGVNGYVLNTITPSTERTSYYFWSVCRNYALNNVRLTTEWREAVRGIFGQDEAVLEAQQKAMDRNPSKVFYDINIDAGSLWARRNIDRMIREEQDGGNIRALRA